MAKHKNHNSFIWTWLWKPVCRCNSCTASFYIGCVCVQCYHSDLKWRSLSNFRRLVGTCSSALPFDPLSVCLGRAQEFASTSRAHCQPAWHHQIYFYSLQIEPLLYPYWHIPRLRGAWLHSRTSAGANLCPDCAAQMKPRWSGLLAADDNTSLFLHSDLKVMGETKTNIWDSILKCVHFLFKKKDIKYK